MYDKSKVLNETAVKRLNVIKEYSDLGSGFGIANKDLAIRGAGDILGSEQAGFIESVGIDMYFKLLNRQVAILKGEVIEEEVKESTKPLLNVETHIDDNYVSDVDLKIEIHKKINEVDSYEKMEEIKQELEDRFGKLDDILINYMYEEWFEKLADKNGVINVDEKPNYIEIVFSKEKSNSINYEDLFVKSLKISREFQFKYKNNLFYIKLLTNNLDKSPIYYLNELLKEM
jgi:transcription-repair coupling factor (superfamily II helicase)